MDDVSEIVVVGAGYVGLLATVRLARKLRGRARVTLVTATPEFVERIRLHEEAAGSRATVRHALAPLLDGSGVGLRIGRVARVALDERAVVLEDGARVRFDRLLLAMGSRVDVDALPGAREHAFAPDIDGARGASALNARVSEVTGDGAAARVLVLGGGLTGIECAAELAERHPAARVTLATASVVGELLSVEGRAAIRAALERLGVTLREGAPIARLEADRAILALPCADRRGRGAGSLDGGDVLPFDVAVFCGGFRPPSLAAESGLACDARGKVLVDATLRSRSHPFVLAAGDCASIDEVVGAPVLDTCKAGMPSGAHAADVLVALAEGREPERFRFADSMICVAVGRRAGVVDRRRPDGSTIGRVITGRLGAIIKEMICRYTWASIRFERSGLFAFRWPRRVPSLTLPPASDRKRIAA